MTELIIRQVAATDLPAIGALWQRAAIFDPVTLSVLEEKLFGDADVTPDLRLLAESDQQVIGCCVGVVRESPLAYIKLIAVDPEWRRRHVGSELLSRIEAACRAQGSHRIRFAESAPNYLTPGVDKRSSELLTFLNSRDYRSVGETANLNVDLRSQEFTTTSDVAALAAEKIVVRRAAKADIEAVWQFIKPIWPSWRGEVECALANDPCSLHLALDHDAVVGFSAYDANNVGTGWFGPMGTDPAYRGKGIGRVLLRRCLADLREQGLAQATIPWVGPVDFYARHVGATLSREFVRFEKEL